MAHNNIKSSVTVVITRDKKVHLLDFYLWYTKLYYTPCNSFNRLDCVNTITSSKIEITCKQCRKCAPSRMDAYMKNPQFILNSSIRNQDKSNYKYFLKLEAHKHILSFRKRLI